MGSSLFQVQPTARIPAGDDAEVGGGNAYETVPWFGHTPTKGSIVMKFRMNGILYMTQLRERGASNDLYICLSVLDLDNESVVISGAWLREKEPEVDVDLYIRGLIMAVSNYFGGKEFNIRERLIGGFNVEMKRVIEELGGELPI